jgi:hypothetical protein
MTTNAPSDPATELTELVIPGVVGPSAVEQDNRTYRTHPT